MQRLSLWRNVKLADAEAFLQSTFLHPTRVCLSLCALQLLLTRQLSKPSTFYCTNVCALLLHLGNTINLLHNGIFLLLKAKIQLKDEINTQPESSHFTVDAHRKAINFVNLNCPVNHKQYKEADITGRDLISVTILHFKAVQARETEVSEKLI